MHSPKLTCVFLLVVLTNLAWSQKTTSFTLSSPDNNIQVKIEAGAKLEWSVTCQGQSIITPSPISLTLLGGQAMGDQARVVSAKKQSSMDHKIAAINYKKDSVQDQFNQIFLACKGDFSVTFRAYNDGVAYRFSTTKKDSLVIRSEEANFNFAEDDSAFIPYSNDPHNKDKYQCSFENTYSHMKLSEFVKDTVAFAPVLVELRGGRKAVITEADLEEYPGMFLTNGKATGLRGDFAPYVLEQIQNERNPVQALATKRAAYIARTSGTRNFPWRVVIISSQDKELLNSDMIYRLASPSRAGDVSWIKPGKVAWDWWNDWNISHVDFRAGVNTATYKYYADFASANHIDYILLDEGWSDDRDIMKIVPEIDLQQIIDYAKQKNVGVWLWMGSYPLDQKMDQAFATYSKMGVRGFKIDFMDRDDQNMVQYYYKVAKTASAFHIMVDFHGAYKPTGLQRTYPNVVNVEGVHGLEQLKWSNPNMPAFDVSIPFIRMIAGPMDYTPGAMRNGTKESFRPINSMPMSQGTRCHQLAMYIVYEAPFEMLSDNPTAYMREQENVNFISSVPTTFNETVALDGKLGAYAAIARRKGQTWWLGAMTNWDARDITLDLSFLKPGNYNAEIFRDGINADRDATDYKKETIAVSPGQKITIHLSNGGGWAARIFPTKE